MKNIFFFLILIGLEIFFAKISIAQNTFPSSGAAGIGTALPNSSSLLDVASTSKGILIPRMTKTQRDVIVTPATGLLIFQTNNTPGFYYYDGGAWAAVAPKNANKSLSNLSAPTAVNAELLPGIDNTINLGSGANSWKDLYLDGKIFIGNTPSVLLTKDSIGNSFVGRYAGLSTTSGINNSFFGLQAGYSNTTGYQNCFFGVNAGYYNTTGVYNSFFGTSAGNSTTTGNYNTFMGTRAGLTNTTGASNVFLGREASYFNSTGSFNSFVGDRTGYLNTTGSDNTADGFKASYSNTAGNSNVAIGTHSLYLNTDRSNLVAIGDSSLYNNGTGAIFSFDGTANAAVGSKALFANTTGRANSAMGFESLLTNTSGIHNTACGYQAIYTNTTGTDNTSIGYKAGFNITTGSGNTFLGAEADCGTFGLVSNSTVIGNGAFTTYSDHFVFGNADVVGWGFGVESGSRAIKVGSTSSNGNGAYLTLGGTWTNTSSREKKEDSQKQDRNSILEKINQLEVTKWKYKGTDNEYHYGPMADDFYSLFNVGDDSSISDMDKTGVLFLGMQALSEENASLLDEQGKLKIDLSRFSRENSELKSEVGNLASDNEKQQLQIDELKSVVNSFINNSYTEKSNSEVVVVGTEVKLEQNVPNPFDNSTVISYYLTESAHNASINIYDASGHVLKSVVLEPGQGQLILKAGELAAGNYSYSLFIDGQLIDSKKMSLIR